MSDREKKLVLFFGLAAFILLNVFGYSLLKGKKQEISRQLADAKGKVSTAVSIRDNYATVIDEMVWLDDHKPEPKAAQLAGPQLQEEVARLAETNRLTIKRRTITPNDAVGTHYSRAKVEFNVSGSEAALYNWLYQLQSPDQFRGVTSLRLTPDAKDDTLIDATIGVEQWYIPQEGGGEFIPPDDEEEAAPETTDPSEEQ